jgi:ribokinase
MQAGQITVVASYNFSLFLKGERLPGPGETVIADDFFEGGGGKGSNQALTAAVLGAPTRLVVKMGNDSYGDTAWKMYERHGLSTQFIIRDPSTHTGIAVICIDKGGHNLISVAPGANYRLSTGDIDAAEPAFTGAALVGFQLENRLEVVQYAIRKVHSLGVTTLLDPAPAAKLPSDLLACIDYIKPNEHEAEIITGIPVQDVASARKAGKWLVDHGVKAAIITLGALGAVWVTPNSEGHLPPPCVQAIDTTGAGDVFCGAFMAGYSRGIPLEENIRFSNTAAAISVTRLGVVDSIPTLSEVMAFLDSRPCN